jgi:hypothetical protein
LEEWGDDDGFGPMPDPQNALSVNQNSRVVVLKYLFTLQGLEEDASLLLDLKEDVREECASLGEVTNVVLYDVSCFFLLSVVCFLIVEIARGRWGYDSQVQRSTECASMCSGMHNLFIFALDEN